MSSNEQAMRSADQTDEELVFAARTGDKAAFGQLVERHLPLARRVAIQMIAHQEIAWELVQEAVLEAYLSLNNVTGTLTTTAANGWGWSLTWRAVNGQYAIVTQSYSFNGRPIAQCKDGVLTYLHADRGPLGRGSTLLATDGQGNVVGGNQPRYFAYGRERTPSLAALPTDYTDTGQKQDGSGLVYLNVRDDDPQIGQFINPDSIIPDLGNLLAYNRFMYAVGNPLRYNDPSRHDFWDMVNTAVDFVQCRRNCRRCRGDVGGVALCGTGVGCVATPAVEAVGTTALVEEGRLLNQVRMAVTKGGTSTTQTEGGRKKWEITQEGTASVKRHNKLAISTSLKVMVAGSQKIKLNTAVPFGKFLKSKVMVYIGLLMQMNRETTSQTHTKATQVYSCLGKN